MLCVCVCITQKPVALRAELQRVQVELKEECQAAQNEEMKRQNTVHKTERQRDRERMAELSSQLEQLESMNNALKSLSRSREAAATQQRSAAPTR